MIPAAAVTLQDVVAEALRLSELLPAVAQKALSATNSKFREMFIAQIRVVTVCCRQTWMQSCSAACLGLAWSS